MDKKVSGIIGVVVVAIIGAIVYFGAQNPTPPTAADAKVKQEDSWFKGEKSAKVEIVEFSDFQCPACGAEEPEVAKVREFYGDKIVFYYRHFPLENVHPFALSGAKAAEAAGMQGKFWEMHDAIFANQKSLNKDIFKKLAGDLGLDVAKFEADSASKEVADKVTRDKNDGIGLKVNSTPTFFINGQKLEGGGISFEEWQKIIDSKLE